MATFQELVEQHLQEKRKGKKKKLTVTVRKPEPKLLSFAGAGHFAHRVHEAFNEANLTDLIPANHDLGFKIMEWSNGGDICQQVGSFWAAGHGVGRVLVEQCVAHLRMIAKEEGQSEANSLAEEIVDYVIGLE